METIFDSALITQRRLRATRSPVAGADFLMRHVCEDLALRLSAVDRQFTSAADLFSGSPLPAAVLADSGKVGAAIRVETDAGLLGNQAGIVAPSEIIPLAPASLDLAVSLLALQEMNDLPGLLAQTRRVLRPDGLFIAAFHGQGTLAELKESLLLAETDISGGASPRVAPFADVRDAGALLQRAGFALPVADVEPITVRYDSMYHLMHDLRAMASTSTLAARSRRPATRTLFDRASAIYAERFADPDGRVRATFAIVWMSGWAPHESQQKPLRPGSANIPLAAALAQAGKKGSEIS